MTKNYNEKLSGDYIRGLVEGQGSFGFTASGPAGNKTPAFQLKMSINNKKLLENIKDYLGLKNKIYEYHYPGKEKSRRESQVLLIVRDFNQLRGIIIPFFYKKLKGYKGKQFIEWLENIGKDPYISDRFKSLYGLCKLGMYDTHPNFINKFKD
ncbi:MAG TPA: LAGLIDADG family homing endonuclease [Candidatus Paceibacterota bacterium]